MGFLRAVLKIPQVIHGAVLSSRVVDDVAASRFAEALLKLDLLDKTFSHYPRHNLLRAYCYLHLGRYDETQHALQDIETEIDHARGNVADKNWLHLYAKYLRAYMADESGRGVELLRLREEADATRHHVSPRLLRDFPIQ